MPDGKSPRVPSYRLHKPSGRAVVRLNGRDIYLGKHGTPESHAEYERVISQWLANQRIAPAGRVLQATGIALGPTVRFPDGPPESQATAESVVPNDTAMRANANS